MGVKHALNYLIKFQLETRIKSVEKREKNLPLFVFTEMVGNKTGTNRFDRDLATGLVGASLVLELDLVGAHVAHVASAVAGNKRIVWGNSGSWDKSCGIIVLECCQRQL